MMSNGLPYLLDAIFGKKDLTSVSLDELNEVISEFPSFNAGHFLLLKKLKEENNQAFEKESMRTALYFHNAFWLQTLLDEKNSEEKEETKSYFKIQNGDDSYLNTPSLEVNQTEGKYEGDLISTAGDELNKELEEILDEEAEQYQVPGRTETHEVENDSEKRVMSFDDLISKYHIDTIDVFNNTSAELEVKPPPELQSELNKDLIPETFEDSIIETIREAPDEIKEQVKPTAVSESDIEMLHIPFGDSESIESETTEEVVNEYGVFEEIVVRKVDLDLEAFDRPIEEVTDYSEPEWSKPTVGNASDENDVNTGEVSSKENEIILENKITQEIPETTYEQDHEAFDRPVASSEVEEISTKKEDVLSEPFLETAEESDKKNIKSEFKANNAESIVFAPYHMIDYFASQGIKLVLEDQPSDNFGKQLKSFTDWLKVMKKLPPLSLRDNTTEKETERIQHFAAHSIEDRDVLTESMAEVLAKQGMLENAIALYQKLSLIYPPKSAYFASRIEQLKASLS